MQNNTIPETVTSVLAEAFPDCHNRFMQPFIEYGKWFVVETNSGETHYCHEANSFAYDENGELTNDCDLFFEDGVVRAGEYKVTTMFGYGAQMQAPGYMDQTEWSVFDTKLEAAKYLAKYYSDNDCTCEEEHEAWSDGMDEGP